MNKFSAKQVYQLGRDLQTLRIAAEETMKQMPGGKLDDNIVKTVMPHFESALEMATQIGLKISKLWIAEAIEAIQAEGSLELMENNIWAISNTVQKEMEGQLFLYVPATRAAFFDKDAAAFLG